MPGLHLVFSENQLSRSHIADSYQDLKYKDGYEVNEYHRDANTAIAFSGYKNYPREVYEDENTLCVCEGLIYDKTGAETKRRILEIADDYLENRDFRRSIENFVDTSDGDFLVLLDFKKLGEIIVFNDRWGRLPTFYTVQKDLFVLSREMKFIAHWIPTIEFDRCTMAEFFMFGYNLGSKTLIRSVRRLGPASLIRKSISAERLEVSCEELLPVNFDTMDSGLTREESIQRCVELYRDSLEARMRKIKEVGLNIVADLSGGFDTRTVFVGLCKMGVDFTCCTDHLAARSEVKIAQQLCDRYGRKLLGFGARNPTDDIPVMRQLTYLTDCMVNCRLTMSSYYDIREREKTLKFPYARFMGFGGEFIRHPFPLVTPCRSLPEMLARDAYTTDIKFADAHHLVGLEESEFRENFKAEVARFPETNDNGRIKHLYFEYYNKMVNGGENRHRLFSWTVQPLWGQYLFAFEMQNIPSRWIGFGFFIELMKRVDPRSLEFPIFGSRVNLKSKLSVVLFRAKTSLRKRMVGNHYILKFKRGVFFGIERLRRNKTRERRIEQEVLKAFQKSNILSSYFDIRAVGSFIQRYTRSAQLYQLWTVVAYLEELEKRFGDKILVRPVNPTIC